MGQDKRRTPALGKLVRAHVDRAGRILAISPGRTDRIVLAVVLLITALDAVFFSSLATLRYLSHNADAFDMGIEDQAAWSLLHGSLFGITLERRLTTSYLGYHFEPISLVGSALYLIYSSPISLVVLKNVVVALGVIPAYWLARRHLGSAFAGVTFALVYALFPGLEAANLYDFHAYTLTAPFLLAAFCFLETRRYGWLLLFLALAAATKENSPLDAVPVGMYLFLNCRQRRLGAATAIAGLAWFGVATYAIIPHFNTQGQGWLWNRYGGMGGSPLGALAYFWQHPNLIIAPVPSDPNWRYLLRLGAPVAELAFLSPTAVFFMLPTLAVNLLTDYGPMHLIETYHYSAHLVPFVLLGAIYGIGTVGLLARRAKISPAATTSALCAVVLAATLVYHYYRGYTPLSGQFVGYTVTAHDRLGNQLARQVSQSLPLDAPISAQGNQYPHLSERPRIWMFPEVDTADTIFLDVSTLPNTTGLNEGIHDRVRQVLDSGAFGVTTAVDGYLVLRRGAPVVPLPDAFYSFARATSPSISHPLDVLFGNDLELLGFDVLPGRDGVVNLRAYWRARQPLATDLLLPFFITDGQGHEVGASIHREPANFWYPTTRWKPGEIVQITSLNLPIGRRGQDFGIALGAQPGGDPWDTSGRLRPVVLSAPSPLRTPGQGALLEVVAFHNDHDLLTPITAPLQPVVSPPQHPLDAAFDSGIGLKGYSVTRGQPGTLDLSLYWTASGPIGVPYTVFAHVLDSDGKLVAQRDSPPRNGVKATTAWLAGETIDDSVEIPLPDDVAARAAQLEVGLYDPATGHRLPAHVGGQAIDHVDLPLADIK
jgi:uncharacterized membrane protein